MTARQHFDRQFTFDNLREIFEERIAHTATTGKDGVSPDAFQRMIDSELSLTLAKVRNGTYRFTTYRQKLVLKGVGKAPREISIATVRDRIVLRAINDVLIESFSDKRQAAPHHYIYEISDLIRPLGDDYSFVQIDVQDFYPSIIHQLLMQRVRSRVRTRDLLTLIETAIQTPTGAPSPQGAVRGVPQGLSISNILSAIYMIRFDEMMQSRYSYFRYVDDIIVVCKTDSAEKTFAFIAKQLNKIGLQCHPPTEGSKSKIVPLNTGVNYLGYYVKPDIISVRTSSYRRMMDTIMGVLTAAKHTTNNKKILRRLNIKITGCIFDQKRRGWMFFFSMTTDIKQLRRLDKFVERAWQRAGMQQFGRPKTFVKTYYEIRYHLDETKYIPRFDEYTKAQKASLIADMMGREAAEVMTWPQDRMDRAFAKIVRKEVAQLENDITPFS
ncbi:reverse transcriptase domain-containing protein [Nitratireductor basaltis]|uniref:RNA-directed DNA polymerase n=1 Tax=Nitratireductor basaltis TaxID=472175 RepID=A0A084U936_9HYPH|nr:reverse transcriptase domain-containing protein [Nitratireductor basaltis]KFB09472.1 RNA-directed DNA polymerase [Nitratireductor basaltis]